MQHEHNHSGNIKIVGVDSAKKAISDAVIRDVSDVIDKKINDMAKNLQVNDSGSIENKDRTQTGRE